MPRHPSTHGPSMRGFTLIELMTVLVILGVLAAVAILGFTKYTRSAHKSEVIGDLSNLSLRQTNFKAVTGHYASTTVDETVVYPTVTAVKDAEKLPINWDIQDTNDAYTAGNPAADTQYFLGGGNLHGFDALRFVPQGGSSWCGYGTISGHGTTDPDNPEAPPTATLANAIFPDRDTNDAIAGYIARDWFYAFALCDFDQDGVRSAFTTQHYDQRISSDSVGDYIEGE